MYMRKHFLLMMLCALALFSCNQGKQESTSNEFIRVENGQFIRNGKPYYFVGTNFWYGAILASDGEGGNLERLKTELDDLKALGINNLRILVGGDGPNGTLPV